MNMALVERNRSVSWLSVIMLCCYSMICTVPYLNRNISVIFQIFVMGTYILSIYRFILRMDKTSKRTYYFISIYILLLILYKFLGVSTATLDFYFAKIKFFS